MATSATAHLRPTTGSLKARMRTPNTEFERAVDSAPSPPACAPTSNWPAARSYKYIRARRQYVAHTVTTNQIPSPLRRRPHARPSQHRPRLLLLLLLVRLLLLLLLLLMLLLLRWRRHGSTSRKVPEQNTQNSTPPSRHASRLGQSLLRSCRLASGGQAGRDQFGPPDLAAPRLS